MKRFVMITLVALTLLGLATASWADNRARGTQVIWRDVNDAVVKVVSVDSTFQIFRLLDQHGQIWSYNYLTGETEAVSPGDTTNGTATPTTFYYASGDCSGTPFITPLPSRATVGTPSFPSIVRIIPNNVAFVTINAVTASQGSDCQPAGGGPLRVIRFDNLPMAKPRGNVGVAPFHPESVSIDD